MFENCLGLAIAIFSVDTSWSISQAKVYQLELAYKLAVGSELSVVQISDILGKVLNAYRLPAIKKPKLSVCEVSLE